MSQLLNNSELSELHSSLVQGGIILNAIEDDIAQILVEILESKDYEHLCNPSGKTR